MSDTVNDILEIKNNLAEAKEQQARFEGKQAALMEQLKKEFDCDTVELAEKQLEELDKNLENIESDLKSKVESFREKYNL